MLRIPLSLMSPAGSRARLSVLIYHRVLPVADPLLPELPTAAEFERTMRWVKEWFNVLPLGDAVTRLFEGTLPARALAITFDDGYADNEEIAAPILQRLGLGATFFVSTGFLGDGCMWNDRVIEALRASTRDHLDLAAIGLGRVPLVITDDRRRAIHAVLRAVKHLAPQPRLAAVADIERLAGVGAPPRPMMQPDQVRRLRALGMDIGGHTVTHPILSRLEPEAARQEMSLGKQTLEQIIQAPVDLFAYPNGVPVQDYGAEHAALVRECGFKAAVSTAWGAASRTSDRFQLPRFTPWDRSRLRYGLRLLDNLRRHEQVAAVA
ncbi:MAG: polysaccharide deacetylase family protein [Piscinibacter sp.]|uniref:polysaccharide deacetylase family protein n=1 Tax=Piscinibacter sp. TaxID=1903157 RepID=UPI002589FB03|nr:polysaccharide deacetylase family protein [Piscinibacter sp.]MCW5662458.1 polysaccharide deacetylase family protein [Piscinibacter sp.]